MRLGANVTEQERNLIIKLVGWYCIISMAFSVTTFIAVMVIYFSVLT